MQKPVEMANIIAERADICSLQDREEETDWDRNPCIKSTLDIEHRAGKELFYLPIIKIALCECEKERDNNTVM